MGLFDPLAGAYQSVVGAHNAANNWLTGVTGGALPTVNPGQVGDLFPNGIAGAGGATNPIQWHNNFNQFLTNLTGGLLPTYKMSGSDWGKGLAGSLAFGPFAYNYLTGGGSTAKAAPSVPKPLQLSIPGYTSGAAGTVPGTAVQVAPPSRGVVPSVETLGNIPQVAPSYITLPKNFGGKPPLLKGAAQIPYQQSPWTSKSIQNLSAQVLGSLNLPYGKLSASAMAAAQSIVQSAVNSIRIQQAQALAQGHTMGQDVLAAARGDAALNRGLPDWIRQGYDQAAGTLGGLAQGFTGGVADQAAQQASQIAGMVPGGQAVTTAGQSIAGLGPGAQNALMALGGRIPASGLEQAGQSQGLEARMLGDQLLASGRQGQAMALASAAQKAQGLNANILDELAKMPAIYQSNFKDAVANALAAGKARSDAAMGLANFMGKPLDYANINVGIQKANQSATVRTAIANQSTLSSWEKNRMNIAFQTAKANAAYANSANQANVQNAIRVAIANAHDINAANRIAASNPNDRPFHFRGKDGSEYQFDPKTGVVTTLTAGSGAGGAAALTPNERMALQKSVGRWGRGGWQTYTNRATGKQEDRPDPNAPALGFNYALSRLMSIMPGWDPQTAIKFLTDNSQVYRSWWNTYMQQNPQNVFSQNPFQNPLLPVG